MFVVVHPPEQLVGVAMKGVNLGLRLVRLS